MMMKLGWDAGECVTSQTGTERRGKFMGDAIAVGRIKFRVVISSLSFKAMTMFICEQ